MRVRADGGAAAAAVTLDLVLRAGGWLGRFTGGLDSCGRLRRAAVRWIAARLAICWGDWRGLATLGTGCPSVWTLFVGCSATLGTCGVLVLSGGWGTCGAIGISLFNFC